MIKGNEKIHDMKFLKSKVFFSAFIAFLIGFLPMLIFTKGIYLYNGDYCVQNTPFIHYMCEKWRSGFPLWDWNSDLGMNFISSYSFYGLFSPIVIIGSLFSDTQLWYLTGIINAAVIAFSALTSCIYVSQYVKKDSTAYICGMLYAFSGYQIYSLVFMFSDSIALFPLLLFSFDKLIHERKKLMFALILAVCGAVNYYFLWGECVFLLIYFIVKLAAKQINPDKKLIVQIAFEILSGILLIAAVMLPNFISILNNSHAGTLVFDKNLLAYNLPVIWKVIQSIFMMPDSCNAPSLFIGYDIDVGSVSLYIPIFVFVGVICIIKNNKKSWYSILMMICGIITCIPVLNSVFSAFNAQFYARWFYMPILILVMITGKYIDDMEKYEIKSELKLHIVMLSIFSAYGAFLYIHDKEINKTEPTYFVCSIVLSIFSLTVLFVMKYHNGKTFLSVKNLKSIIFASCIATLLISSTNLILNFDVFNRIYDNIYNDGKQIEIDDDSHFRVVTKENSLTNAPICSGYPQIDLYNSLIPSTTTNFFKCAGIKRTQIIVNPDNELYPLSSLLSVKYQLYQNPRVYGTRAEPEHIRQHMKTFELSDSACNYVIFKNPNYIPMGFCYDYYIKDDILLENEDSEDDVIFENGGFINSDKSQNKTKLTDFQKQLIMLKAIVLTDEQAEKYKDILEELPESLTEDFSDEAYVNDCAERRKTAAYEFTPNNNGFTARINLERDNLVFFSVPYDKGFTAYIDGNEAEIEKVFNGLCAVKAPKGDCEITFEYTVLGLKEGIAISLASLFVLIIYAALIVISKNKNKK